MIRHVFVAHPKGISDAELEDFLLRCHKAFHGRKGADGSDLKVTFTTGRESAEAWIAERRGQAFNWRLWIAHVTGVTTPFGGEPRFHYFVVGPERVIGRATADLLRKALSVGRRVFRLDGETLIAVQSILTNDDKDWKKGWIVAP